MGENLTIKQKKDFLSDASILILVVITKIYTCAKIHMTEHQKFPFYYTLILKVKIFSVHSYATINTPYQFP